MIYLREGDVVDTYGGDFTYEDEYYEIEDGMYVVTTATYGWNRGEKINEEETVTLTKEEFNNYIKTI